jgi:hypothetical protein
MVKSRVVVKGQAIWAIRFRRSQILKLSKLNLIKTSKLKSSLLLLPISQFTTSLEPK